MNGLVRTAEPLLSLPGSRSDLRLNGGVDLRLWGALPELRLPFPLLESYSFTFQSGEQVEYEMGQCPRCRTIYWEKI